MSGRGTFTTHHTFTLPIPYDTSLEAIKNEIGLLPSGHYQKPQICFPTTLSR